MYCEVWQKMEIISVHGQYTNRKTFFETAKSQNKAELGRKVSDIVKQTV